MCLSFPCAPSSSYSTIIKIVDVVILIFFFIHCHFVLFILLLHQHLTFPKHHIIHFSFFVSVIFFLFHFIINVYICVMGSLSYLNNKYDTVYLKISYSCQGSFYHLNTLRIFNEFC